MWLYIIGGTGSKGQNIVGTGYDRCFGLVCAVLPPPPYSTSSVPDVIFCVVYVGMSTLEWVLFFFMTGSIYNFSIVHIGVSSSSSLRIKSRTEHVFMSWLVQQSELNRLFCDCFRL